MSGNAHIYEALPTSTSIRVLVLAPGEADDEELFCWLMSSDLDQDHERFPDSVPRPIESMTIATTQTSNNEERTFFLPLDCNFEDHHSSAEGRVGSEKHPFQRYEALSYVWGDTNKLRYIYCNGEEQFSVTENLYAALRSLRLPRQGRRLWVDAICINQIDHEEKKSQIALMRRVYQQASRVIAFLPLSNADAENVIELAPKIWRAREAYDEKQKEKEANNSLQPGDKSSLNSISALETTRSPMAAEGQRGLTSILQEQSSQSGSDNFLEDFGIPPMESHLWRSWRRLFASPYFRRIWILQEYALAKDLHFWFGSLGMQAELVVFAQQILGMYSGTYGSNYMSMGSGQDDDDFIELSRQASEGSHSATQMSMERIFTQNGSIHRRLIEMLSATSRFQATDWRDKIYALLGLVLDGADFVDHVSYAAEDTFAKTFIRFAKLFVEKGEGIELLLQAAPQHEQRLPSWVPDWGNPGASVGHVSLCLNSSQKSRMQVLADDQKLLVLGTVVDEVEHISDLRLGSYTLTADGPSLTNFLRGMVRGILMIFNVLGQESWSVDDIFESLFDILAQPAPRSQKNVDSSDTDTGLPGARTRPSASQDPTVEVETGSFQEQHLRKGFRSWLSWIASISNTMQSVNESESVITLVDSPKEYHAFQQRAMRSTAHRRFCITKERRIGLVPDRTEVGEHVAIFAGSDNTFVLHSSNPGSKEGPSEQCMKIYRLVGNAYLHDMKGSAGYSKTAQEDILLI